MGNVHSIIDHKNATVSRMIETKEAKCDKNELNERPSSTAI